MLIRVSRTSSSNQQLPNCDVHLEKDTARLKGSMERQTMQFEHDMLKRSKNKDAKHLRFFELLPHLPAQLNGCREHAAIAYLPTRSWQ